MRDHFLTFQEIIERLNKYWQSQGCVLLQPIDLEVGAGTFHPGTFLKAIGPEPWFAAHVQLSRRPSDGRYGENPNRLQKFHQYQVVMKPSPDNLQTLYLNSLKTLGIDCLQHDIRFVEDNWESPTLGAWGLGWEVWLDGMEITQYTYFQQVGGLECAPVMGELAYGIERLAMYLQGKDSLFDLIWAETPMGPVTYGDICHNNEVEMSIYNFEKAPIPMLKAQFEQWETQTQYLVAENLPLPAYEAVLKASHTFNLLDSRGALSVTERQQYILRIRTLSKAVATTYYKMRESLGFPLCPLEVLPS